MYVLFLVEGKFWILDHLEIEEFYCYLYANLGSRYLSRWHKICVEFQLELHRDYSLFTFVICSRQSWTSSDSYNFYIYVLSNRENIVFKQEFWTLTGVVLPSKWCRPFIKGLFVALSSSFVAAQPVVSSSLQQPPLGASNLRGYCYCNRSFGSVSLENRTGYRS